MKSKTFLLLMLFLCTAAGAREFTSKDGRKINAELLAHSGEQVILKVGAKEFVVAIESFSVDDQQHIKEWIAQNPGAVRYKFGFFFDFEEDRSGRIQGKAPGGMVQDKLKVIPYECEMIVFNKEIAPVEGIEIRYEIYIDDYVVMKNNAFTAMAVGAKASSRLETVAGRLEVPKIDAGGRIDFFRMFDTQMYIDRDGGKTDEAAIDKVRGVRLRVYRGGVVIGEGSAGEAGRSVEGIAWQETQPSGETVVKK
ncbi:MAG: hypothetical protein KDN18_13480 [Verrucomicrobiae bacterium]|nr:hypothetical protein [Verrucomicrobiae bacterium]